MKKLNIILFLCMFLGVSASNLSYFEEGERGIWLRPPENIEEIPAIVREIAEGNFNTIYLETFYHGYSIAPNPFIPVRPSFDGKDVLQLFLDEANGYGIEIHLWVEVFYWKVDPEMLDDFPRTPLFEDKPYYYKARLRDGSVTSHAEFAHIFANPAVPEVQEFLKNYFEYLIMNYDVTALQLDYIRYSAGEQDAGYDSYTRGLFEDVYGVDPMDIEKDPDDDLWQLWVEFREDIITGFVADVNKLVRRCNVKKEGTVQLTAAVAPYYYDHRYRDSVFQDWKTWFDKGYIDVLLPMCYAGSIDGISSQIKGIKERVRGPQVKLIPGLAAPKEEADRYGGPERPSLDKQFAMIRDMSLDSYAVFCYCWLKESDPDFATVIEFYRD